MGIIFSPFDPGQQPTTREYNRLVDAVNSLLKTTHTQYYRDSRGLYVRRDPDPMTMTRRAFVKNTPGAETTVDVFLDEDDSDEEVTVECYIYGGGNLEDAYPTLVDGMPFYVHYDKVTSAWKNLTPLFKIGVDCSG